MPNILITSASAIIVILLLTAIIKSPLNSTTVGKTSIYSGDDVSKKELEDSVEDRNGCRGEDGSNISCIVGAKEEREITRGTGEVNNNTVDYKGKQRNDKNNGGTNYEADYDASGISRKIGRLSICQNEGYSDCLLMKIGRLSICQNEGYSDC
eukprot:Tbor_TRINITY_DN5912_c0_g1::TRINITY_DN5912_c0_g1_i2::g.18703::m.18703